MTEESVKILTNP